MNLFWIWMLYFLMAPGLPAIGNPDKADCLIVLSMGRNQYYNKKLGLARKFKDKYLDDYDAISQVQATGFKPVLPNKELARQCWQFVEQYHKPIITQWEVACGFNKKWYEQNQDNITCLWPPSSTKVRFHINTKYTEVNVLKDAAEVMAEHKWHQAIILAHRRQMARAYLLACKFLPQPPLVLSQTVFKFDPKSLQWQSRNNFYWFCCEIPCRWHHVLSGLIL